MYIHKITKQKFQTDGYEVQVHEKSQVHDFQVSIRVTVLYAHILKNLGSAKMRHAN